MLAEYLGLLLVFVMGFALLAGLLVGHLISGPRDRAAPRTHADLDPPTSATGGLDAARFYGAALLFSVFGTELVFLYPWGAVFSQLGWYGFFAMGIFALPLVVAFYYQWMKGAFEW